MTFIAGARELARDAFVPGTDLPTRAELRRAATLGLSGHALVGAVIDGDHQALQRLLRADPALASGAAGHRSMLEIATAAADPVAMSLLLAHGAALDGPARDGRPLVLALHATDPRFAWALLASGAAPTPPAAPLAAFDAAIALGSPGGVALLLDWHADPNVAGSLGRRPLDLALATDRFTIAELLLDRGADPRHSAPGAPSLAEALTGPSRPLGPDDRAARLRLGTYLRAGRWHLPA